MWMHALVWGTTDLCTQSDMDAPASACSTCRQVSGTPKDGGTVVCNSFWEVRFSLRGGGGGGGGGGGNRAPKNWGTGGGWEKCSIDRTINRLL